MLILAAGESERFNGPGFKEFLEVKGEPVIGRVVRMVSERGYKHLYTVTDQKALNKAPSKPYSPDGANRWTCETLLSTSSLWPRFQRVAVLLGDTYYTTNSLDTTLYVEKNFCVYSDTQDIFALTYSCTVFDEVRDMLSRIVLAQADGAGHNKGRLWELYRAWHRLPDHAPVPIEETRGVSYEPIADRTQDFDTMEEYESFMRGDSKNVLFRGVSVS